MEPFAGLRPATAVLAVAIIATIDLVFWWRYPPIAVAGVMDETAHMLTALLLLSVPRVSYARGTVMAVVAGAVLIDVDHVPMEVFGWDVLARGTVRPYTHSLATLLVLAGVWVLVRGRWRPWVAGLAFGFVTHLLRDVGPVGLPLYWPVSAERVGLPYAAYATLLVASVGAIVARGVVSSRRGDRAGHHSGTP